MDISQVLFWIQLWVKNDMGSKQMTYILAVIMKNEVEEV